MLRLLEGKVGVWLFLLVISSFFYCRSPKGNIELSSTTQTITKQIKEPKVLPLENKEGPASFHAISLNGLPLSFRVAELVRAMGQPDSIVVPNRTCFQDGEIFRQYCYGAFTCMTFGDLSKMASAPRVVDGLVEQINFNLDTELAFKGQAINKYSSLEAITEMFSNSKPVKRKQAGGTLLEVSLLSKEGLRDVGFYFKDNHLVKFTHFSPCS